MAGIIEAYKGLCVSREDFGEIMGSKHRRCLSVREKLPPNIPTSFQTQTRVLKLYRILDRETVLMAKSIGKSLLQNVTYNYNKIRKYDKYEVDVMAHHQKVIVNHIVAFKFATGEMTGECLLKLGTGLGKTRIGVAILGKIGACSIVIVPTKHIAEQWIDELKICAPQIKTCVYNNQKNQSPDNNDVTIIIVNTAAKKDASFFGNYTCVIMDEVHELTTKVYKNIMWSITGCRFLLGLTATPHYAGHGLLPFLEGFLGPTLDAETIPGFDVAAKLFNVNVQIVQYVGKSEFLQPVLNKGGTVSAICTIEKILSDPNRLELTISIIAELYSKGCNILVFGEHRVFLERLYEILKTKYKEDEIDVEAIQLKGGATRDDIEKANKMRIVLTTFGYSRRGVSYPHLNALVLATPRRSQMEQIIGRILRMNGDETITRHIRDIVDKGSVLASQIRDRLKVYKERRYAITYRHIEVDSDED